MHLIVLIILGSVLARDEMGGPTLLRAAGVQLPANASFALVVLPMLLTLAAQWWVTARCGRAIDATGRAVFVGVAQRMLRLARWMIVAAHLAGVFVFGTLDAARALVSDLVLVDEILAVLPALVAITLGWMVYFSVERRIREAEVLRLLDRGSPVRHAPGAIGYVSDQFRHQVLIVMLPVLGIIGWRELVGRGAAWAVAEEKIPAGRAETVAVGLEFAGVLVVLLCMPFVLRRVWRTRPLGDGPLRERLSSMCGRAGVRCRDLLVWVTHGMMINGAVVGLLGRARYILLTDGLLEEMEEREVEAVMAHEIAHVVYKHIAWLMAALIITVVLAGAAFSYVYIGIAGTDVAPGPRGSVSMLATESAAIAWSLFAGILVFGFVSRRFERQADAFAVRMLAEEDRELSGEVAGPVVLDTTQPRVMIDALSRVASLNHIPRSQFMWRHGSILSRQRALASLAGHRTDALPIDRSSRRLKGAIVLAGAIAAAVLIFGV
ncbi:MAG: M48 family metallopeptidase [Phycisphaerales bacterium]